MPGTPIGYLKTAIDGIQKIPAVNNKLCKFVFEAKKRIFSLNIYCIFR
jgi:hypothetical protein